MKIDNWNIIPGIIKRYYLSLVNEGIDIHSTEDIDVNDYEIPFRVAISIDHTKTDGSTDNQKLLTCLSKKEANYFLKLHKEGKIITEKLHEYEPAPITRKELELYTRLFETGKQNATKEKIQNPLRSDSNSSVFRFSIFSTVFDSDILDRYCLRSMIENNLDNQGRFHWEDFTLTKYTRELGQYYQCWEWILRTPKDFEPLFKEQLVPGQAQEVEFEPLIEITDDETKRPTDQIRYLAELGVIDHLFDQFGNRINARQLSQLLSIILNCKYDSVQGAINAWRSKDEHSSKHPFNSEKKIKQVRNQLEKFGFYEGKKDL